MGASAATIWFSELADPKGVLAITARPDATASQAIAERVLGAPVVGRPETLARAADPEPGHVYVGAYGRLTVVTHVGLKVSRPSELDDSWWDLVPAPQAFLLVTDAESAVGSFAHREGAVVRRSFAAHPVDIIEDEGVPELFEGEFWAGKHPLTYAEGVTPDPRALPFHPMEFAEQANREFLGFRYTHPLADTDLDPARIPVIDFVAAQVTPPPLPTAPQQQPTSVPPQPTPQQEQPPEKPTRERGRVRSFFGF